MKFSYYDTLANLVVGYLLLFIMMNTFEIEYDSKLSIVYLSGGFILGYYINTISSWLEDVYYYLIGGMPSIKLLQIKEGLNYTGIKKVKFYEAEKAIELLKADFGSSDANEKQMFGVAMRMTSDRKDSQISTFNAQYAFSRVILTFIILASIFFAIKYYDILSTYIASIIIILASFKRYKERGYYYAKEVLTEYLNCKK